MSAFDVWGPFLCWLLLCAWWWLLRRKQTELARYERNIDQSRLDLDGLYSQNRERLDLLAKWEMELRARERAVTECTAAIHAQINKQIAASMRTIKYLETEARPAAGQTPEKT